MTEAFVTLSTNDNYCLGSLVLGQSLRNSGTTRKLVILVTSGVSSSMRDALSKVYDVVKDVNVIDSKNEEILAIMRRPELGITLTKLHCWRLTEYTKCVFMDSDMLVVKPIEELFEKEELSAVADIGWPDCFNSGLFVFSPSEETHSKLVHLLAEEGSFDGGDQGLLNMFFSDWFSKDISKHLSFIYNMSSMNVYSYPPAYKQFGQNVKVVHFLGTIKPWMYGFDSKTGSVLTPSQSSDPKQLEHVQSWWNIFMNQVQPLLSTDCSGIAGELSKLSISHGEQYHGNFPVTQSEPKKENWENGNIDYLGADSFDNIKKKLDDTINKKK